LLRAVNDQVCAGRKSDGDGKQELVDRETRKQVDKETGELKETCLHAMFVFFLTQSIDNLLYDREEVNAMNIKFYDPTCCDDEQCSCSDGCGGGK
jgi:hypothetical protein